MCNCAKGVFNICRAIISVMPTGDQSRTSYQFLVGSRTVLWNSIMNPKRLCMNSAGQLLLNNVLTYYEVNAPGWIETGMLEAGFNLATEPARARQDAIERSATHRFGYAQDITTKAIWLPSDEASFVTGQISQLMAD